MNHLYRVLSLLFLSLLSIQTQAELRISVSTDQQEYLVGTEIPKISLSGYNTGVAMAVDVHVGIMAPDGTIYEVMDWNKNLKPLFSNVLLPNGFDYPTTQIADLKGFPGGLTVGKWQAAAAFTKPGTLQFLHISLKPFDVVTTASDCQVTANAASPWAHGDPCNGKRLYQNICDECHRFFGSPIPDDIINNLGEINYTEMRDIVLTDKEVLDIRIYLDSL